MQHVALIFDNEARPETTGGYCLRALQQLVTVQHFLPSELERIPRQGFDLYLNIDDGLPYRLPGELHPSAWWAIDTHLDLAWCRQKAPDFDFVFAAQRDGAEWLRQEGIASATWLPLACDPEIHRGFEGDKTVDVCFVGNVFDGPRADLLNLLRYNFRNCFVGQCYFEEMAKTYSSARIVFNRSVRNDVNMRVFEALACGSLLLTNDLRDNGQEELFGDGVHLATYRDGDELLDKVRFYLAREAVRERIAAAGRQEAIEHHTYRHRMEKLLAAVEASLAPTSAILAPVAAGILLSNTIHHSPPHEPGYFEFARPELLEMIPASARRVLDVGCGAGRLGEALKARQPAEVIGIEAVPEAAQAARARLDQVVTGDMEQLDGAFPPSSFDAIICGDVLEHLRDPARTLRRLSAWLRPDGQLLASIPNVRHHSVVRGLLEGHWTYETAGLLDRDHLRFFTRREIEKLFFRAGLAIKKLQVVPGPEYDDWAARGKPGEVNAGRLHIAGLSREEAEEFYVYQYLVTVTPVPAEEYGLTSIVILTHNQLDYTRQCLDSIRLSTDEPYELILVDYGSTDGTVDYLQSLPGVQVIANATNRGFPAAANQGMQAAKGRQVLLLNNDTLVTTGWLWRLLRALHSDPKVGLAGPCSNFVSGPQLVEAGYDHVGAIDGFAWDWGRANDRLRTDSDRLVGFCLLIRREVIDEIGLLDERFGVGCFEDDDYCLRAVRAGFRAVIARDAFVHHFGGQTFRANGIDFAALVRNNEEIFRKKWNGGNEERNGRDAPPTFLVPKLRLGTDSAKLRFESAPSRETEFRGVRSQTEFGNERTGGNGESNGDNCFSTPSGFALRSDTDQGLWLTPVEKILSLCMIVRNNGKILGPCLESIRPYVDEMDVTDTGSSDDTAALARRLGARVFSFPWCDSFAKARNESIRHARGRWIWWMDSDDLIDPANGLKLRRLSRTPVDRSILGFVMSTQCPGKNEDGEEECTVVTQVKMFRNLPELRWERRIHEQIIPAIRRANGEIAWSDVFVVHAHYDTSPEGQRRKLERDLYLLNLELQDDPNDPL